jgi:acetyl-CoA carboxylase carboxyltransferase component
MKNNIIIDARYVHEFQTGIVANNNLMSNDLLYEHGAYRMQEMMSTCQKSLKRT